MINIPSFSIGVLVWSDNSSWLGCLAWVLSALIIKEFNKVVVMFKSKLAHILFKVSIKKLESAPSKVLEPISSLLKTVKTFMLSLNVLIKLFKAANVHV